MTILNAAIDLVSFSGILYTIYPPLFVALLVYSIGGTAISLRLGRPLVGLNFQQEAQEANFRSVFVMNTELLAYATVSRIQLCRSMHITISCTAIVHACPQ